MALYAIGDLHMPGGDNKPMDIFGPAWENHVERIFTAWRSLVREEDTVLIPGDITWAMYLSEAAEDLKAIGQLPGRKLFCKGNHDYWWSSLTQVRSLMPENCHVLQHSAMDIGDYVVCGTRGWMLPTPSEPLSREDEKIYRRELARLELALNEAMRLRRDEKPILVMLHYPPLYQDIRDTDFTRLLKKYPVSNVVYGHLHGPGIRAGWTGEVDGILYQLVSCDAIGFTPVEVLQKTKC